MLGQQRRRQRYDRIDLFAIDAQHKRLAGREVAIKPPLADASGLSDGAERSFRIGRQDCPRHIQEVIPVGACIGTQCFFVVSNRSSQLNGQLSGADRQPSDDRLFVSWEGARMRYVKLGRTGLDTSPIWIGCMGFGEPVRGYPAWSLNEDASRALIRRAVRAGINFFDTANMYSNGSSEEILGGALRDVANREVWSSPPGCPLPRAMAQTP